MRTCSLEGKRLTSHFGVQVEFNHLHALGVTLRPCFSTGLPLIIICLLFIPGIGIPADCIPANRVPANCIPTDSVPAYAAPTDGVTPG